jgi:hypothetical protein
MRRVQSLSQRRRGPVVGRKNEDVVQDWPRGQG